MVECTVKKDWRGNSFVSEVYIVVDGEKHYYRAPHETYHYLGKGELAEIIGPNVDMQATREKLEVILSGGADRAVYTKRLQTRI